MFSKRDDVAKIIAPPPLLFFFYLGIAWAADTLYYWHVEWMPLPVRVSAAIALILFAGTVGTWAILVMKKAKTPVEPWMPTERIITCGPFCFTRNPL